MTKNQEWEAYLYEQGEPPTSIKEKLDMIDLADVKGYARVKGLGDVIILSEDVGGLTFVARWVRSDSITDRTEEFYWGKESDDGAEEEPMNEVKRLRLAAGLTQQELSVATGIYPGKITDVERDIRALNKDQWDRIQLVCNNRIKMFKRDAGLTIKLG